MISLQEKMLRAIEKQQYTTNPTRIVFKKIFETEKGYMAIAEEKLYRNNIVTDRAIVAYHFENDMFPFLRCRCGSGDTIQKFEADMKTQYTNIKEVRI